ncbi:hypothetical protein IHQ71_06885 [Rhizobium sp. TH2]|uniref:hypothetical protein n=1 Tax=Rhizobium sp. TH2 TaxID=2775403 RepID=UPI0021577BF3|nr:hypothetical protein [Rhizobium sp. TH2]UVC10323.1 hypothetical protein IHQ71_06885 [Rhizobium sp. TH2]
MLNIKNSKVAYAAILTVFGLPGIASACENWDLGRSFTLSQGNGAVVTVKNIQREGRKLSASAKFSGGRGDLDGSISANGRFKFTIDWDNGSSGVYTAHVEDDGEVVDGRTYDRTNTASWSTWTMPAIACGD